MTELRHGITILHGIHEEKKARNNLKTTHDFSIKTSKMTVQKNNHLFTGNIKLLRKLESTDENMERNFQKDYWSKLDYSK